jgi:hypothetical protein
MSVQFRSIEMQKQIEGRRKGYAYTIGHRMLRPEHHYNRNCREQAISQVCAFPSPFFGMMSVIEILQQSSSIGAGYACNAVGKSE